MHNIADLFDHLPGKVGGGGPASALLSAPVRL